MVKAVLVEESETVETIPETSSAHGELDALSWALRSHPGAVRPDNEDCVGAFAPALDDHGPMFVVADGMGGHAAGEVASRIAVETVLGTWTTGPAGKPQQALRAAVRAANVAVFAASMDQGRRGMGTTLTAMALADGEALIGHVGDSRAYLVRGKRCSLLTSDHSRVGEMLRMRLITPEQAAHHPARSQLTRSLGGEPAVQVDLVRSPLVKDDAFVLCTDGVWDLVSMQDIAEIVSSHSPDEAAEALVDAALLKGAPDNITAIVVRSLAEPSAPAPAERALRGPAWLRRLRG